METDKANIGKVSAEKRARVYREEYESGMLAYDSPGVEDVEEAFKQGALWALENVRVGQTFVMSEAEVFGFLSEIRRLKAEVKELVEKVKMDEMYRSML